MSGGTHVSHLRAVSVVYRALTVSGGPSQGPSTRNCFSHWAEGRLPLPWDRTTPKQHRPSGHLAVLVWALPISLAATLGISFDFCAGGTKMFLFPPSPSLSRIPGVTLGGCPIRTSTDHWVLGPSPSLLAAVLRPSSAPQRQSGSLRSDGQPGSTIPHLHTRTSARGARCYQAPCEASL